MNEELKEHWNKAYLNKTVDSLGWYEEVPEPSIELVEKSSVGKDARILIAGAGATTLVDYLVLNGYSNITVCDISDVALDLLSKRIGKTESVSYLQEDLINPKTLIHEKPFDLWIDRAVFHFFTKQEEQEAYKRLVSRMLKANGQLVIASFTIGTAPKCSGLDVKHYNADLLIDWLGADYSLVTSFESLYTQPSGNTRDYIYTLFKKK